MGEHMAPHPLRLSAMAIVKDRYPFARSVFHGGLWAIRVGNTYAPLGLGVSEAKAWRAAAMKVQRGTR